MRKYLLPKEGKFYKVNMHSHSNYSDGVQTPEELKEIYKAAGYSAIAYTEHEALFDLTDLNDEDFIAITSYEYALGNYSKPAHCFYEGKPEVFSDVEQMHLNLYSKDPHNTKQICFNPKYIGTKQKELHGEFEYVGEPDYVKEWSIDKINEIIRTARENDFLVCYNHPNWSLNTYETYSRLDNLNALEICNGASHRGSDMDYTPYVYDQMLRAGKRIICVGGDDNHDRIHFFKAWTMVKAESLTHEKLLSAIERGDCYASSGPEISELYYEDGKVTVKCLDADAVYLYTAGRRRARTPEITDGKPITEATFTVLPTDQYFRIAVKDSKGNHADTRAYFLDELE
jgi:hypothetical protein